jgi:hypothetical protein
VSGKARFYLGCAKPKLLIVDTVGIKHWKDGDHRQKWQNAVQEEAQTGDLDQK